MEKVKKIWIHPYTLTEKITKKKSKGVLLKILFSNEWMGYGTLHPHPQLKEQKLSYHLNQLKKCQYTHLTHLCIEDAWMDAKARSKNQNLFTHLAPIQSHHLISDIKNLKNNKMNPVVKIKMGSDFKEPSLKLKSWIQSGSLKIKLRLDFNYRLQAKQWGEWSKTFSSLLPYIDFIEDPFVGFEKIKTGWPFAWDWGRVHHCPIRVIKASRHSLSSVIKGLAWNQFQRVTFTHALTHPLEARLSYVKASKFYQLYPRKKEVCGLYYPDDFFIENDFSNCKNFYSGTGLGFDELLKQQKWSAL